MLHAEQGQERDAQALQAKSVQVCETYYQRTPTDSEGLLELVRAQVQLAKLEKSALLAIAWAVIENWWAQQAWPALDGSKVGAQ